MPAHPCATPVVDLAGIATRGSDWIPTSPPTLTETRTTDAFTRPESIRHLSRCATRHHDYGRTAKGCRQYARKLLLTMKMASVDPDFAGTDAFYEMCGLDAETIARIQA